MPLLGPIGGGLGLGAAASGASVVAAAGVAALSSAALTTSLEFHLLLLLLFFEEKNKALLLLVTEFVLVATFGVSTNPEAADAMLAMNFLSFFLSFSLSKQVQCGERKIDG